MGILKIAGAPPVKTLRLEDKMYGSSVENNLKFFTKGKAYDLDLRVSPTRIEPKRRHLHKRHSRALILKGSCFETGNKRKA